MNNLMLAISIIVAATIIPAMIDAFVVPGLSHLPFWKVTIHKWGYLCAGVAIHIAVRLIFG